jgi:hypothetical protein
MMNITGHGGLNDLKRTKLANDCMIRLHARPLPFPFSRQQMFSLSQSSCVAGMEPNHTIMALYKSLSPLCYITDK